MGKIAGIPDSGNEKMRAAVYYDKHDVRIEGIQLLEVSWYLLRLFQTEICRPELKDDEVLVKVAFNGCNSNPWRHP